jgi:hypothetical protein
MPELQRERPPFAIVPEWIIHHPGLNGNAVRVYAALDRCGERAFPAKRTLAARCQIGEDALDTALRQLVAAGALTIVNRGEQGAPNLYILREHPPGEGRGPASGGGPANDTPRGHRPAPPPRADGHTPLGDRQPAPDREPDNESQITRGGDAPASRPDPWPLVAAVYGARAPALAPAHRARECAIAQRLIAEYGLATALDCLRAMEADPFHRRRGITLARLREEVPAYLSRLARPGGQAGLPVTEEAEFERQLAAIRERHRRELPGVFAALDGGGDG